MLAYSTVSQLGYMFMAAGMRAYGAAIFMLVAHAFYKALMFLGAGSVMHGMHDETDMREMGGLIRARCRSPRWTFAIGALSLAGVPFLAGFFAKDEILEIASSSGRPWVYVLGSVGALLSALYIGRLIFLTFFGDAAQRGGRARARVAARHDGAAGAAGRRRGRRRVCSSSTPGGPARDVPGAGGRAARRRAPPGLPRAWWSRSRSPSRRAGLVLAWFVYASGRIDWLALRVRLAPIQRLFANGWYLDNYYAAVLVRPAKALAAFSAYVFDARFIDGAVNGSGGAGARWRASAGGSRRGSCATTPSRSSLGAVGVLVYVGVRF